MKTAFIIGFLVILVNTSAQEKLLKNQDHDLNKALIQFRNDNSLKNASIGFYAMDTKTGETIAELNPDLSLMPASTQKIITSSTAFEVLGKNFTYRTYLQYSGVIDTLTKILHGDIYIKGGADPTLGSKYFDKNKKYSFISNWINSIKEHHIDSIDGRIIADASVYGTEITPPKILWEDVANYYGAGANGLSAFDNLYEIHFSSSDTIGVLTRITKVEPEIPGLSLYNEVVATNDKSLEAFIFGAPYNYINIIRGAILRSQKDFSIKGAIPDPAYYLAYRFDQELKKSGIGINSEATTDRLLKINGDTMNCIRKDLQVNYSPSLKSIVDAMNRTSINLFAEHLFNEIAHKIKNEGSNTLAIQTITEFWKNKGMDTDGFYIFDGSGLSRSNAVSSRQLVFILDYMLNKSKNFDAFFESLPISGKSGTLKSVGINTSAEGIVHAKSGSIDRVRAYAGYLTTKSGRTLAFSLNVSNYNCSDTNAKEKLTSLMVAMADFNL